MKISYKIIWNLKIITLFKSVNLFQELENTLGVKKEPLKLLE